MSWWTRRSVSIYGAGEQTPHHTLQTCPLYEEARQLTRGETHPDKRAAVGPGWRPLPDCQIHQPHQTDSISAAIHDWTQKKKTFFDSYSFPLSYKFLFFFLLGQFSVLQKLHWLSVKERILYKILPIRPIPIHVGVPHTILAIQESPLSVFAAPAPRATASKTVGPQAFAVAAPYQWNALPSDLRLTPTISLFKPNLKIYLFWLTIML